MDRVGDCGHGAPMKVTPDLAAPITVHIVKTRRSLLVTVIALVLVGCGHHPSDARREWRCVLVKTGDFFPGVRSAKVCAEHPGTKWERVR